MPYAPGITYQPIQADMSGWGRALMHMLGQKDAKAEQAKKEAQEFKTYVAMGKQIGLNPDELTTADLATVKGMVEGKITKTNLERAVAEFQKMQREGQAQDALTQAVSRAGQKQVNVPAFQIPGQPMGTIMPQMTAASSQPMTTQSFLDAIAKHPQAANSPEALSFLDALQRGEVIKAKAAADMAAAARPVEIPKDFVPLGASVDENGKLDIRYGPPKAEGKALTQTEVAGIAALNQAEQDLNVLENIYKELGPDYGGPVSARVKSMVMGGQNPNIAALENAITAATPNLARGVFREVGVLTDQDVARYKQLLPAPTDTQEVRTRKIKQLRDRIAQGRKEMVTSLQAAGRDVEGFDQGAGGAPSRFDSEAAARSAGAQAGDIIELYDPATATYRKARLK